MILGLTNGKNTVKYGRTAYKPYQERWRERPDETRQPAKAWCQIRRRTTDEDSIDTHIGSAPCVLFCFMRTFEPYFLLSADLLLRSGVCKILKYTEYSCDFAPCRRSKSQADITKTRFCKLAVCFCVDVYERMRTNGKKTVYF